MEESAAAPAPATGWEKQLKLMVILPGGRETSSTVLFRSLGRGFGNLTKTKRGTKSKTKKEEERAAPAPATGWDQTINPPARRSPDKYTATRGFSDTVIACFATFNLFGFFGNLHMK